MVNIKSRTKIKATILSISLLILSISCNNTNTNCSSVHKIVTPLEHKVSSVIFIYYEINSEFLKDKITGELLAYDIYENDISKIEIYSEDNLIGTKIAPKVKKYNQKTYLVYGSSRFETTDTLIIHKKIKNEKLKIILNNGEVYELINCASMD